MDDLIDQATPSDEGLIPKEDDRARLLEEIVRILPLGVSVKDASGVSV
jgi:hypothetical protein